MKEKKKYVIYFRERRMLDGANKYYYPELWDAAEYHDKNSTHYLYFVRK